MEETQRQAAIDHLDAARADEREAETLHEQLAALRAEAADQPARMERLNKALATDRERELLEWSKRLPADADGETLEQLLEQERTIITDLRAQIGVVGTDLAMVLSRPAQAADEITTLHRRIEELTAPLVAQSDEPAALFDARRLHRSSEQHRSQATLELRLTEQDTATQRQSLHELALRELRYRLGLHEKRVEHLQQRITNRGRRELEALSEQLIKREQELAGDAFVLASAAVANRALGAELIQQNIENPYDLNQAQFDAVVALLTSQRDLINRYWHDAYVQMDDFENECVVASGSWPFQVNVLQFEGAPIASVLPSEGATGWADSTMMLVDAPHPNCAYKWLEWSLNPKLQGDLAAWFGSVPSVPSACTGNELLTDAGCAANGFENFDKIWYWRTPTAECSTGKGGCIPYRKWVEAYVGIISK